MVGRVTASRIALASAASVLPRFTEGLTVAGGICFHRMPRGRDFLRPVMRRATGLHPAQAWRHALEELHRLAPASASALLLRPVGLDTELVVEFFQVADADLGRKILFVKFRHLLDLLLVGVQKEPLISWRPG